MEVDECKHKDKTEKQERDRQTKIERGVEELETEDTKGKLWKIERVII